MSSTTPLEPTDSAGSLAQLDVALHDDTGPDLDDLAVDLRIALLRVARRLRAEKSDDELSSGQFSVLAYLDRFGPRTPGELAEAEHVRPPSMTRTVAALTEAGLVERTGSSDDRRRVLVSLTEVGRRTVEETRRRRTVWLARRLADLGPDDLQALATSADVLRRMSDA